jgi:hypothetical protein
MLKHRFASQALILMYHRVTDLPNDPYLKAMGKQVQLEWICSALEWPVTDATGIPIFKDSSHLRASYVEKNIRVFDDFVSPQRKHTILAVLP